MPMMPTAFAPPVPLVAYGASIVTPTALWPWPWPRETRCHDSAYQSEELINLWWWSGPGIDGSGQVIWNPYLGPG